MQPPVSLRGLPRAATVAAATGLSVVTPHADDGNALLLSANYSKPLRWTFGGELFVSHDLGSEGGVGTIVDGSEGTNGMQAWGGRKLIGVGGADVRAVLTRTGDHSRGAPANSTYVGGSMGWRLSVGYAKSIAGPSTRAGHVVTWGMAWRSPFFSVPEAEVSSQASSRDDEHLACDLVFGASWIVFVHRQDGSD